MADIEVPTYRSMKTALLNEAHVVCTYLLCLMDYMLAGEWRQHFVIVLKHSIRNHAHAT